MEKKHIHPGWKDKQLHPQRLKKTLICIFYFCKRYRTVSENSFSFQCVSFSLRSWEIHAYPWSLTERVIHWLRHFSSCPLLLMCCVHLSHQMCLCVASNTRCTQCWNALEKYIQRLDRALALSQHSEVGMVTAVQSSPLPLLPHQPPSLFKNVPCLPYIGSCHHC